jgi:hypothetical protein
LAQEIQIRRSFRGDEEEYRRRLISLGQIFSTFWRTFHSWVLQ